MKISAVIMPDVRGENCDTQYVCLCAYVYVRRLYSALNL